MLQRLAIRTAFATFVVLAVVALAACGSRDAEKSPALAGDAAAEDRSPAPTAFPPPPGSPGTAAAPGGKTPPSDHVVVEVNGQPIRARKLLGAIEMNRIRARSAGRPMSRDEEAALHEAALSAFVADELLYQAATADGIVPVDAQITEEVASVRSSFPSAETYQAFLKEAGVTQADVREEAARRITVRAYVKKLAGNTAVPEAEARAFYEANKQQFGVPEQVRAAIIVVLSNAGDAEPARSEARTRIDEAHKRAVAGEDFAALARQHSQIPNASRGGELPPFGRGDGLFPKIEDMAFSTQPGQVSPVFETPTGLCVVKTLERFVPRIRPFEEIKSPLIGELGEQKEGAAVEAKIEELRGQAKIEIKDASFLRQPPPPGPAR